MVPAPRSVSTSNTVPRPAQNRSAATSAGKLSSGAVSRNANCSPPRRTGSTKCVRSVPGSTVEREVPSPALLIYPLGQGVQPRAPFVRPTQHGPKRGRNGNHRDESITRLQPLTRTVPQRDPQRTLLQSDGRFRGQAVAQRLGALVTRSVHRSLEAVPDPAHSGGLALQGAPPLNVQATVQGSGVPLATARLLYGADPCGPS